MNFIFFLNTVKEKKNCRSVVIVHCTIMADLQTTELQTPAVMEENKLPQNRPGRKSGPKKVICIMKNLETNMRITQKATSFLLSRKPVRK